MKVNSGQASSTLIPEYIGSDFDKVIEVADNIEYVIDVAAGIEGLPVHGYIGETPPTQPKAGAEWYCTLDGRTYVWYVDDDSSQWVEGSPQSTVETDLSIADNIFTLWKRSAAEAGLNLVAGSFEEGGVLTSSADVLLHKESKSIYAWSGAFPHSVEKGTNPTLPSSGYVQRTDVVLRNDLAASAGASLVGFKNKFLSQSISLSLYDKVAEIKSILDFGVDVANSAGDTAAFQLAANSGIPIYIPSIGRDYVVSHVDLPDGTIWYGDGKARVVQSATDIAAIPGEGQKSGTGVFRSAYGNHKFSNFTIVPQSEAIAVEPAAQDNGVLVLESMVIDGLLNTSAQAGKGASGVFARNIKTLKLVNTKITGVGTAGSWSGSACVSGVGDGITTRDVEFLIIDGNCHIEFAGRNGVSPYSTRNVSIAPGCVINNCYQSAIQGYASLGSSYTGRFSWCIDGVTTYHNCADSIDMNWIYSGQPEFDMRVANCKHYRNGWFQGDTTKGGNDGSGIGTYRSISNVTLMGNIDIDCRGVGLYLTNASNIKSSNNLSIKTTAGNAKEGLFIGQGINGFRSSCDTFVTTSGTALSLGGSQTLEDVKFSGGKFSSGVSYGIIEGSGSTIVDDVVFDACKFKSAILQYLFYGTYVDCEFISTSTSGAIGADANNIRFDGLKGTCAGGWFFQSQNKSDLKFRKVNLSLPSGVGGILLNGCDNCEISNSEITVTSAEAIRLFSNGANVCDNTDLAFLTLNRTDGGTVLNTNIANNTYKTRVVLKNGTATHTGGTTLTATYA